MAAGRFSRAALMFIVAITQSYNIKNKTYKNVTPVSPAERRGDPPGGAAFWRTAPRMVTWILDDPEALVVWLPSEEDKVAMIASDPARFFATPHYDGTPILLVSLQTVDVGEARELITDSWRVRALGRLSGPGTPSPEAGRSTAPKAPCILSPWG